MAVGRISGPLLKSNLIRNGIDLAFETDLLYLDVNNQRIGIKQGLDTANDPIKPQYELDVNGTTRTTDLIVDNCAYIGDVKICGTTIETTSNYLNLGTFDNIIYNNKLTVDDIDIEGNVISTNISNSNLELRPNGTGSVEVHSDLNVEGNIHATGNISADGNITIGDANTDNVTFNAEIASDLIPDIDNFYKIGNSQKRWNDVWVDTLTASEVSSLNLVVDGIDLVLRPGNTVYVAENGDDTKTGTHPQDPVASIKQALNIAQSGDTVFVNAGTYTEQFPLTVPKGVSIKGIGIRGVKVVPTTETRYNDAFLLNGESTIEDLTVADFYSGGNYFEVLTLPAANQFTVNVGTSPFAHTYVSGGIVESEDSTVANITNATYNHLTGGLVVTTDVPHDTFIGQTLFLKDLTFSCNGGTRIFPDNGYAFRFATDFEVTTRSPYIKNISVITAGSATTAEDPRGFNAGDAGKGAYVDGAYATANSKEASMLFHSVTFITPGVDALTATNGARIEWLNSFTYFANKSLHAFDSNDGLKGNGKTRVRLGGVTGTFTAGNTITFTSTDSSSVASATIDSVDGDVITVDGKWIDLLGFDSTPASITDGTATATEIVNYDLRDFGAEIRMIGSASVYGNYGLYGNGPGVLVYAIGHNLAYIGNGKEVTNDPATVIQANEVIELDDAQIRYNSVDHKGDFRVGDLFYVNQEDGTASFSVSDFTINTTNGVTFNTGGDTTFIDGTKIETGDWRISGNTVETLTQDADFDAATNQINLNANVNVDGNLDVTGNVTIGGNITIGDEATDTIQIVAGIDSDIIPSQDSTYSLGTPSLRWNNIYVNEATIDDVTINNNYITTNNSNANLELRANGTGVVLVPENNVQIENDLTVVGTATLGDTNIIGTLNLTGDMAITGDIAVDGSATISQTLTVGALAQFEDILIDGNVITTTISNSDLELRASGTGQILIPNNNVSITNDIDVTGDITSSNLTATGQVSADRVVVNDITIDDNVIQTTTSNADLELRASGTGKILVPSNDVTFSQALTVSGTTDLQDTNITGTVTHIGNVTQTGNFNIAGEISNGNILIEDNFIATTNSNSDLELRASGTGEILVPNNNVQINNNLTVGGDTDLKSTTITGTVTHVGDLNQTGNSTVTGNVTVTQDLDVSGSAQFEEILVDDNFITTTTSNANLELRASGTGDVIIPNNDVVITNDLTVDGTITVGDITSAGTITANRFSTGDILIDDNFITTTTSNSNLELRASGTGNISIPSNDFQVDNNFTVAGNTNLQNTTVTGTITHTGNTNQTGNVNLTGILDVTGAITISSTAQFENIRIAGNVITTTESNSDLELRASGTGNVIIPNNNVNITNDLTVGGQLSVNSIIGSGNISANSFSTGDILIDDNFITTTTSNSDLELRANGTGSIVIDDISFNNATITSVGDLTITSGSEVVNINSTGALKIPVGDISQRPTGATGQIRYNNELQQFEGYNGSIWTTLGGVIDSDRDTFVTAELTPGANDNVIRFTVENNVVADINSNRLNANRVTVDNIEIDGNVISTVTTNTDLLLTANGTGNVVFENFGFKDNAIINQVSDSNTRFITSGAGYVEFQDPYGVVLPVGDNTTRPVGVQGMIRFNTEDSRVELYDGSNWVSVAGASAGISFNDAEEIAIEKVLIFG